MASREIKVLGEASKGQHCVKIAVNWLRTIARIPQHPTSYTHCPYPRPRYSTSNPPPSSTFYCGLATSSLSWFSLAFSILTSSSSSLCLLLFLSSSSNLFLSTVHLLAQPLWEGRWQGWRAKGQCKIKFSSGAK